MKVKNSNNSSEKTKKLINDTFIELIFEKKELNKITVSELVRRANIHRTTFYTHYSNIYEIVDERNAELIEGIFSHDSIRTVTDIHSFFNQMFNYLNEKKLEYRMLVASDEPIHFMNNVGRKIKETIVQEMEAYNSNLSRYFALSISSYIDAAFAQYLYCFRGDTIYSPEETKQGLLQLLERISVDFFDK